MGTYTSLNIASYEVITTKSFVNPVVMTIFRESDKQVFEQKPADIDDNPENELYTETICRYSSTVGNIKQRLDVMGFSLEKTKADLTRSIEKIIAEIDIKIDEYDDDNESLKNQKHLLKNSSFNDWLHAFSFIIKNKTQYWHNKFPENTPPLVYYIFTNDDDEFSFPCSDIRFFIRYFLEVSNVNDLVIQDISHLVGSGYYDINDEVCKDAVEALTIDYPVNSKIIVITEGSTDRLVLESALHLLYPHLAEYYSFIDFEISNSAGGVSTLVSAVKAFVGSGIANRVIAVFDNDTAATVAQKSLIKTTLPQNIKVISYPNIDYAKSYPTIGPTGISKTNINGLACSIELYMGIDVLTVNGELTPIQWKGYDESIKKYQGEILHKRELLEAFKQKIEKSKIDNDYMLQADWSGLKFIWQQIFLCFT